MRLIDLDSPGIKKMGIDKFGNCIYHIPPDTAIAEAEPIRHGHWEDGYRSKWDGTLYWFRVCSNCGYERKDDNTELDTNFCPNCGAKMDEVNDDR